MFYIMVSPCDVKQTYLTANMVVSWNWGTPKSSNFMGCSLNKNPPAIGVPLWLETAICPPKSCRLWAVMLDIGMSKIPNKPAMWKAVSESSIGWNAPDVRSHQMAVSGFFTVSFLSPASSQLWARGTLSQIHRQSARPNTRWHVK